MLTIGTENEVHGTTDLDIGPEGNVEHGRRFFWPGSYGTSPIIGAGDIEISFTVSYKDEDGVMEFMCDFSKDPTSGTKLVTRLTRSQLIDWLIETKFNSHTLLHFDESYDSYDYKLVHFKEVPEDEGPIVFTLSKGDCSFTIGAGILCVAPSAGTNSRVSARMASSSKDAIVSAVG